MRPPVTLASEPVRAQAPAPTAAGGTSRHGGARAEWSGVVGSERWPGKRCPDPWGKPLISPPSGNLVGSRKEGGRPPGRLHIAGSSSRSRRTSVDREETLQHRGAMFITLVCDAGDLVCLSAISFHERIAPMGWSTSKLAPEGGG